MRLSDIKGKKLFEMLGAISAPLSRIVDDPEVVEVFERKAVPEGMDARRFAAKRLTDALPAIFGAHADDFCEILGTLAHAVDPEMTAERYAEEGDVVKDLGELVRDKAFLDFLGSL